MLSLEAIHRTTKGSAFSQFAGLRIMVRASQLSSPSRRGHFFRCSKSLLVMANHDVGKFQGRAYKSVGMQLII